MSSFSSVSCPSFPILLSSHPPSLHLPIFLSSPCPFFLLPILYSSSETRSSFASFKELHHSSFHGHEEDRHALRPRSQLSVHSQSFSSLSSPLSFSSHHP